MAWATRPRLPMTRPMSPGATCMRNAACAPRSALTTTASGSGAIEGRRCRRPSGVPPDDAVAGVVVARPSSPSTTLVSSASSPTVGFVGDRRRRRGEFVGEVDVVGGFAPSVGRRPPVEAIEFLVVLAVDDGVAARPSTSLRGVGPTISGASRSAGGFRGHGRLVGCFFFRSAQAELYGHVLTPLYLPARSPACTWRPRRRRSPAQPAQRRARRRYCAQSPTIASALHARRWPGDVHLDGRVRQDPAQRAFGVTRPPPLPFFPPLPLSDCPPTAIRYVPVASTSAPLEVGASRPRLSRCLWGRSKSAAEVAPS